MDYPRSSRATVAQLVEHRVIMRKVVSSTPAGPTLRVAWSVLPLLLHQQMVKLSILIG